MAKKNPTTQPNAQVESTKKAPLHIPVLPVFFLLLWTWGWLWYGDVFRIAREESFWAPDAMLMAFETNRPWGTLWQVGLFFLQSYRWPILGGFVLAVLLTKATYFTSYCLRLRGWWRLLQFLPAIIYLTTIAYQGFDVFFESEPARIFGVPFVYVLVMGIIALMQRSFTRHRMYAFWQNFQGETTKQNRALLLTAFVTVALPIAITHWMRPYVRVVTTMQCQMMKQDWQAMQQTARAHGNMSYRQIAAYYAIATVQRGEQGTHIFDLLLDYDEPYLHGYDNKANNATNYYVMDCDFAAGLIQTANHHAMEHMTMHGPTIRSLKMLCKCALVRGEWEVARKYITILKRVPFEGEWITRYEPMIGNMERVNNDPEIRMVRLVEPQRDSFENQYIQPVFLGYNAALTEGNSINALWNSLCVQLYTKTMPQFVERCQPLQGTTPPQTFSEALLLLSSQQPELLQAFPSIQMNGMRQQRYFQEIRPFMQEREKHVRELYPRYKGYYPYYYFFGNLKATKKQKENAGTSNQGVN